MTQETRKSARQIHEESGTSLAWFQFARLLKDTLPHWEDLRVVAEKTKAAGRAPFDYLLNNIEEQQVLAALPNPRKKKKDEAEPAAPAEPEDAAVPEVCDTAEPQPEPEREIPSAAAVTRALTRAPKADDVLLLLGGILDTHAKNTRQAVEHMTEGVHMLREGWRLKNQELDEREARVTELLEEVAQLTKENERLQKELATRPAQQLWGRRSKPNAGCER